MARIAVFSKYFGYNVGGAERSVVELLKAEEQKGHKIVALVAINIKGFGGQVERLPLPASWEVREISLPRDFVRFRFVDYFLNKMSVKALAEALKDTDILYSYGSLAPALINSYQGKSVYLVRDEYGLGWNVNYYKGLRGVLQSLYFASEFPLKFLWRLELSRAIRRSRLIANSQFVANELNKLSPLANVEIIYSHVNRDALAEDYEKAGRRFSPLRGVVVIGDNVLKGGDVVRKVASKMSTVQFYIFDRKYTKETRVGNIAFMPWMSPGEVYLHASVVMVPSRWEEAFPRAVLEAQVLDISVVASARGGIPEAIDDKGKLISDVDDIDSWIQKLSSCLN